jgi:hypothetical protein
MMSIWAQAVFSEQLLSVVHGDVGRAGADRQSLAI